MTIKKITVPDLGEASEVEVIELLVSVGQKVQENDSLLVLESDKAAMEIPAPFSGTVNEISVNLGDQVTTGSEILTLETESAEEDESDPDALEKSEPKNVSKKDPVIANEIKKTKPKESEKPSKK